MYDTWELGLLHLKGHSISYIAQNLSAFLNMNILNCLYGLWEIHIIINEKQNRCHTFCLIAFSLNTTAVYLCVGNDVHKTLYKGSCLHTWGLYSSLFSPVSATTLLPKETIKWFNYVKCKDSKVCLIWGVLCSNIPLQKGGT